MAWLITGGAGYIGAHVVRDMVASGRDVVVLDDLSTGRANRLPAGVPLIKAEVSNRRAVR
ncbi:MAG TPA: NAD-dependent epimerase/dehydratase family protein, partial [Candidatus Limnocylindrales bacterium]|nr:NAD-dependent epimerase/dehydratase family protein [Candidatus Limnocylindrales bacterium]